MYGHRPLWYSLVLWSKNGLTKARNILNTCLMYALRPHGDQVRVRPHMMNNIVFAKLDILTFHGVTSIWSYGFYTSPPLLNTHTLKIQMWARSYRAITSPFFQTSKGGKPLKAKKATPSVDFDLAGTSTKVNVHTDKSVDMHTNVQIAQGTIPSSSVITNNSFGNVKTELIQGLKHGFILQYNWPRLPVQSKNSRSISENPALVRERYLKKLI